ncbi:DTW domain-containing protein [Thiomicrorhabdus sp. ZW0627]|uniref:tRNA-uridine aminocarboxypropyltransferase n=1 Tax=Thiomicrorhabdus sp. ZW0627 TaxID=3039774 RepID=UPI002436A4C5|nr:DTW domain-containing protein [Thiomicrorhabdus sp. ZW0627]MDG6773947.1 DTW domain-containing protein [Thiomicrorhabdus sp. ZW0627]
MSRIVCPICSRPEKVCLCPLIRPVDNRVEIGILQHPSEVTQIKGTARIAQLGLSNCRTWVGEDFSEEDSLFSWLESGAVYLLYPETEECDCQLHTIEQIRAGQPLENIKVLVIDGTWRKAHKIVMANPALNKLPRIMLKPAKQSAYKIRKQKNSHSLSTIEAIYEVLSQLENDESAFTPLLTAFDGMVEQQMAFRPSPKRGKD